MAKLATPRWLTDEQQQVWRTYLLGSALLQERIDADLRPFGHRPGEYEILVVAVGERGTGGCGWPSWPTPCTSRGPG